MGLDTSHECWHGPYSEFDRWRAKLASLLGYQVEGHDWFLPVRYVTGVSEQNLVLGDWTGVEIVDHIDVLMWHSDCEGKIEYQHTLNLASRLAAILTAYRTLRKGGPSYDERFVRRTETFIEGLRLAHKCGEDVEFH